MKTLENIAYKNTIDAQGNALKLTDYTIKEYIESSSTIVDGKTITIDSIIKTEHVYPNGDIYNVTTGNGFINRTKTYPVETSTPFKSEFEILRNKVDDLLSRLIILEKK